MLSCKHLSWCHNCRLTAIVRRVRHRQKRNDRLSGTDISLNQTLIEARKRLVFDELFLFILNLQYQKEKKEKEKNQFSCLDQRLHIVREMNLFDCIIILTELMLFPQFCRQIIPE